MTEDSRSERSDAGSFAPHVPYIAPRKRRDGGPAGSLEQARERERALRAAERGPAQRDPRTWVAAALLVAAVVALLLGGALLGPALCLAALLAAAAVIAPRYRRGAADRALTAQIRRERHTARALEELRGHGWTVLHDRLVPGTEHRVAHVLAGPAGVVVATPLPVHGPVHQRGDALMTGDVILTEWFGARWWEVEQINEELAQRLSGWPWKGPIYPVVLVSPESRGLLARLRREPAVPARFPFAYRDVALRSTDRVRHWVTAMPAPLGQLAVAELTSELADACPPAATAD
ncbi:hypothetical protein CLV92_102327 [Kineococcus xinjiangensis]|uniref:Nuclease-like protein n=1 Tax=Kineococcus xinjiangensis TaxID=512762 RepID=A0A2S6IVT0_9ACTN|nr:NERD domain-containing protein [Kineococcus xinjiangensis]PPK98174.1 hypothetical protein CLV92_102327 [Kineococcus xinjiangensis]